MFTSVNRKLNFGQNYTKDTLLPDNLSSRIEMSTNNTVNAFTTYPIKGLKGSKNSNFHEFLTMGIVPYLVGSGTMIGVSAATNKFLSNSDFKHAKKATKFVALGVIFYGLMKKLSDGIINTAVRLGTGINSEIPYAKINYQLKEHPGELDSVSLEYHKIGESVDYTYWPLLYGKGNELNKTFDEISKKNGLGEDLIDSDQDGKPVIREVFSKSTFAKNLVSYFWAATGVALANQKQWLDFDFSRLLPKFKKIFNDYKNYGLVNGTSKNFGDFTNLLKDVGKTIVDSNKSLWKEKYGKALILISGLGSLFGIANTLHIKHKSNVNNSVISENKESVEC